MATGLVIRYFGNKWCVCDGVNHDKLPEEKGDLFIGHRFSEWFDTWEEASNYRKEIYETIARQLGDAAIEYENSSYSNAAIFLKNYTKEK